MSRKLDKLVVGAMALLSTGVFADTHVWKAEGRVNDWNWNEPGNYDSSLGAAGVPEAGDIVQLPDSADIFVLGTDDVSMGIVSGLSQVVTPAADSRVIFDLGSGVDLSVNGAISSVLEADRKAMTTPTLQSNSTKYLNGLIIKRGDGTLRLSRFRYSGDSDYDVFAYYTRIICEEGKLHLPITSGNDTKIWFFGHVAVSNNATFYPVSSSVGKDQTTRVRRLFGEGVITNLEDAKCVLLVANGDNDIESVFDGVVSGNIALEVPGRLMMRSVNNVHLSATRARSFYPSQPWRGTDGVAVFGVQKLGVVGEPSSLGPNGQISYTKTAGAFLYIGDGETTDKNFTFDTPMARPALFDAGANGGIDFTGDVVHASDSDIVTLRLGGDNASTCTLKGAVSNGVYFVKEGSGTWRFADDPCYSESRRFAQSMILDGGTLQFDSMEERGWRCSLGTAASPSDVYWGARNDAAHPSEFAYLTGTNAASIMEFTGTNGAYATQRPIGLRGNLTLKNYTSHPWRFSGVRPATTGAKTLVLDSTENVANELAGVKDTLESPITIEKTGSGTWTLNGSNTIHGLVSVKNGTLKVRNASGRFRYYRLTIRDSHNPGKGARINIGEIALYDVDGKQVNKGLTRNDNYHAISAGQCAFMRFGYHWPPGFQTLCNGTADQTYLWFADGGKKDSEGGVLLKYDRNDTFTHAPLLMMLADDAAEVKSYDVLLYSDVETSKGSCPGDWLLEGSPDMLHWTQLHEVTKETFPNDMTGTNMWVGAKVQAERGKSLPATHEGGFPVDVSSATIPCTVLDNATVSVASGAELVAEGDVVIRKLALSKGGNGSIAGFAFAEDGTLEVTSFDGQTQEISVALSDCTGFSNLSKWAVSIDGEVTSRYSCSASADGKVRVSKKGTVISIR